MTNRTEEARQNNTIQFLVVAILVALMIFGYPIVKRLMATQPTGEAQPAQQAAASVVVTQSGDGEGNTKPFHLNAGTYAAKLDAKAACTYLFEIKSATAQPATFNAGSRTTAGVVETNLYNVEDGDYYLWANTGPSPDCPWDFTLQQQ